MVIDAFNTDFGRIEVLLHTAVAENELLFINREQNTIGHYGPRGRPHLEEAISTSGGNTGPFLRRVFYDPPLEKFAHAVDANPLEMAYVAIFVVMIMLLALYTAIITDIIQVGVGPLALLP